MPVSPESEPASLPILPRSFPSPQRDLLLRVTLFAAALGAILAAIYSMFLASYGPFDTNLGLPAATFHQVVVPVLALAAVAGALILERQPVGGMFLLLAGALLSVGGGAIYLLPAAVLGCIWAQRRRRSARSALGFILLIPGIVTVYYGLAALLSFAGGESMPGMPPSLDPPGSLGNALKPLLFLPVALLGAWLLADDRRA